MVDLNQTIQSKLKNSISDIYNTSQRRKNNLSVDADKFIELGDKKKGLDALKTTVAEDLYHTEGVIDLESKARVDLLEYEKAKLDK